MGARKLEFPDEQFLEEARRDGRATLQQISMDKRVLKPDTAYQARVLHLDPDHVKKLVGILRDEDRLSPVVIFKDKTGKLRLADGFHRHDAYRREGKPSISAWVIDGDASYAIAYATMCNRKLSLARTKEDVRKSILMLLALPEWFKKSDTSIANHVGMSYSDQVARLRKSFCGDHGLALPLRVESVGGYFVPYKRSLRPRRPPNSLRGPILICQPTMGDTRLGQSKFLANTLKVLDEAFRLSPPEDRMRLLEGIEARVQVLKAEASDEGGRP